MTLDSVDEAHVFSHGIQNLLQAHVGAASVTCGSLDLLTTVLRALHAHRVLSLERKLWLAVESCG